jgi:AraC-like DNA-binding protein
MPLTEHSPRAPGASIPAIRPDWLFHVSTLLQRALCEEAFTADPEGALLRIVPRLPLPRHRAEELALSGLLMAVIWRERLDTREAIETGIRRLSETAAQRSSLSAARRAADHLTRHPAGPLRIAALARRVGVGESSLRREFKVEYGITLRTFHQRTRVGHAVLLMMSTSAKLSSIARDGGYASDAHFHRAVRQCTGHTAGALRRLPRETLLEIAASLVPRPRPKGVGRHGGASSRRW